MEEQKEKIEEKKEEIKKDVEKEKQKIEEKKVEKAEVKVEKQEKAKDKIARVYLRDAPMSTKQAVAICRFIKGKKPQEAIELLKKVIRKKIAIPMRGEIAHKKGTPQGKYPVNAAKIFIKALNNLIGNAKVKLLDAESIKVSMAKADKASRPIKATRLGFGVKKFKRTNVRLEGKEVLKLENKK